MKLENRTRAPALLYRGGVSEDRLFGSVFARVTYRLEGRELAVADEQSWEVSTGPWDGEYGPMDSDEVFYRGGVDLFVFGSARAPLGKPVPWLEVTVQVGQEFRHRIWVFGERQWVRQGDKLVPTEPVPFRQIPLTQECAFGGKDEWDKLPVPFPDNPDGKGFYLEEATAEGKPLPNLEDPDNRITRWDDRPEPVGTGATTISFGPRARRGAEFDEETGALKTIKPCFFNSAFPGLVVPAVSAGDEVIVTNVVESGPFHFFVPESPLRVWLRFGEERIERELAVDQIGIEPDAGRVFVAWRHPFRYRLIPLQERECVLEAKDRSLELEG